MNQRSWVAAAIVIGSLTSGWACTRAQRQTAGANESTTTARSDRPGAAPAAAEDEAASDEAIARVMEPWAGDLDGMVERRQVRMLVTFSKTNYFVDKAEQHGVTYDAGKLLEAFLNERLKTKTMMLHVVFIPVSRDRIFEELARGRGDIAAAAL